MNLSPPTKEVDVALLVFVERYATDLLKWDILTLFADKPNFRVSVTKVANRLGRSTHTIRPELGNLAMSGILSQTQRHDGQTLYKLTSEPQLRKMTLKFAKRIATA